jgi:hypothetical protein
MQVDKLQASYCAHTRFDVSCLKMKCGPATRASLLAINSTNGYLLSPPPPGHRPARGRAGDQSEACVGPLSLERQERSLLRMRWFSLTMLST